MKSLTTPFIRKHWRSPIIYRIKELASVNFRITTNYSTTSLPKSKSVRVINKLELGPVFSKTSRRFEATKMAEIIKRNFTGKLDMCT